MDDDIIIGKEINIANLLTQTRKVIWKTVNALKAQVDKLRGEDYNAALELSDTVMRIGETLIALEDGKNLYLSAEDRQHEGVRIKALGMMARGDTIWMQGDVYEGWDILGEAGSLFLSVNDEVGWARTRIGRLFICNDVGRVTEGEADAIKASQIFNAHNMFERMVPLQLNLAVHYQRLKRFHESLVICADAEKIITTHQIEEQRDYWLGAIMCNRGINHRYLGNMRDAEDYFQKAVLFFEKTGATYQLLDMKYNIAYIYQRQGKYRDALDILYQIYHEFDLLQDNDSYTQIMAYVLKGIGECYISLNRDLIAIRFLHQALDMFRVMGISSQIRFTLTHIGLSEMRRGNYPAAGDALREAEAYVEKSETPNWIALIQLYRGVLALVRGRPAEGIHIVEEAYTIFDSTDQHDSLCQTLIVWGELWLAIDSIQNAIEYGQKAFEIMKDNDWLPLRFAAHKMLGMAYLANEKQNLSNGQIQLAEKHFQLAMQAIEQQQRNLSLALRTNFMADKQAPLRELTKIYLDQDPAKALATLERGKAQVWQNYALNHNILEWRITDEYGQNLLDKLEKLRKARLASQPEEYRVRDDDLDSEIRAVIEQLNVHCERLVPVTAFDEELITTIQEKLDSTTALVEYYSDGTQWWAFVIISESISVIPLSLKSDELEAYLGYFEAMIFDAIQITHNEGSEDFQLRLDESYEDWQMLLEELYDALMRPIVEVLEDTKMLIIVPHSQLHNVPFNLLHDGKYFLIELLELTLLPAASLLLRNHKNQPEGATVLGYTQNHDVYVASQAEVIADILDTEPCPYDVSIDDLFSLPAAKVLHIAAHGEFNATHPDLSFIELHKKRLYLFDIWQYDVAYELVVLSACETGRSKVYPGDELIGLGSNFLYKGVQSLVMSLWQVRSDWAMDLMQDFYSQLLSNEAGKYPSKSSALQATQVRFAQKHIHPLFWGAFQLIGDPKPLF